MRRCESLHPNFGLNASGFRALAVNGRDIRRGAARLARFSHSAMKLSKAIQPCQIIGRAFVNQHAVVSQPSRVNPGGTAFTRGDPRDFGYRDLAISMKYSDWRVS
ncbi:hypothetical protein [Bradyrhizobium sp.]|uniref:hypothetical protein n=1 Tax=Bradyrhizobium sp. TaxID=376 RepID=UPI0027372EB9|nr:hypothetical protein [Bradyrhizobium sp.]MDP3693678.1 hypothetical protein [Bradyrhizobium sp.]